MYSLSILLISVTPPANRSRSSGKWPPREARHRRVMGRDDVVTLPLVLPTTPFRISSGSPRLHNPTRRLINAYYVRLFIETSDRREPQGPRRHTPVADEHVMRPIAGGP